MNCNIVKDLIPLYIDSCTSSESKQLVEEHMAHCAACRKLHERMTSPCQTSLKPPTPVVMERVNTWKASVLQSASLFVSFALITVGVALEARTPIGASNGHWAVSLIIPATAFLLSLANWYFVRLYRSRKLFSTGSLLYTLGFSAIGYLWATFHYAADFTAVGLQSVLLPYGIGALLMFVMGILSKVLSNQYGKMIGKE